VPSPTLPIVITPPAITIVPIPSDTPAP
jgi:hypothetical protein